MNYIVMDLEWNQPLSHRSAQFQRFGKQLMFDLIQIGAVKLDMQRRIIGSFSQLIQPGCYKALHPRISRITGILQEDLYEAPPFKEAFERFAGWCGEEDLLLTWGCDDISVFQQNLDFYLKDSPGMLPVYDLQRLYGALEATGKNRAGLQSAMKQYQIKPSEEHPFHSAVDDAYYTALVFQKFPETEAVSKYPLAARAITPAKAKKEGKSDDLRFSSITQALESKPAREPNCPVCGKRMSVPEGYAQMRDEVWRALADCSEHGLVLVDILLERGEDGKPKVKRHAALAEQQNPAYVKTKHLQWAGKVFNSGKEGVSA